MNLKKFQKGEIDQKHHHKSQDSHQRRNQQDLLTSGHVFLRRSEVPSRQITTEFLISIIPITALFIVIAVMFCGLFCR